MLVTVYYGCLKNKEAPSWRNTSVSLFRQELDLIPRREFDEIVLKYDGDKTKQSFDCWVHFVSMIFCQLAQANSLRKFAAV